MNTLLGDRLRDVIPLIQERSVCRTFWRGVQTPRSPPDAWVYQEIIHETRPDFIVEVGNHVGGGLLFLADMCELCKHGAVVGVSLDQSGIVEKVRQHPRITLIEGDAVERLADARAAVAGGTVMVIEDSSHAYEQTLAVMEGYGTLVTPGCYMIVEDTICGHGIPFWAPPQGGPAEAVETYLSRGRPFVADMTREWPITWNHGGYLRRV